jgi:hypothetical protein
MRIEWRGGGDVRPVADDRQHERAADHGKTGRQQHGLSPAAAEHRGQQVGKRLAERERADEQSEREAAAVLEPAGGDLHGRWIDQGQRCARQEPEPDHRRRSRRHDHRRVGERAGERPGKHQRARVHDVGDVAERAQQRARDKPRLHGHREPRGVVRCDLKLLDQQRRDRRSRKPQRHSEKLGERNHRQVLPRR